MQEGGIQREKVCNSICAFISSSFRKGSSGCTGSCAKQQQNIMMHTKFIILQ